MMLLHGQLVIHEVCARNFNAIEDNIGASPDFIELKNISEFPIALQEYAIADKKTELLPWPLPERTLQPGEIILLFASGRNSTNEEIHTPFKVSANGEILFLHYRLK